MRKSFVIAASLLVHTGWAQHSPVQPFQGKIGTSLQETTQAWPEPLKAPAGAPNIVWILLDDVGFGAVSTFGGLIETPVLDSLADNGLRYTNFHTVGICAPTRAALLTGRNHHSVHMGLFPETAIGTPGYDAIIPFEKATVGEILRENGYSTFALGKWHITPLKDLTGVGPFHRWPTGRGFDHFYGFPARGSTDQWHPELWEDINRESDRQSGKHLNELLSDKAIKYISSVKSGNPEKPFFLYLAPGAGHSPHQVSKEWIEKYRGVFDEGWDVYRERVIANQKKLGIIPQNTQLPERNAGIVAWNTLNDDQKKLYSRLMEAYAGFLSYTDREIGRIVRHLRENGELENTLIVVSVGDNGGSKEGTFDGVVNTYAPGLSREERFAKALGEIDLIGTEYSKTNFPLGWAAATNVPFRLWKQDANSEGGTRNPLILFYPKKIREKGGIRHQYAHVIDVLPTTLELAGLKNPEAINGYAQEPVEGISLAYSLDSKQSPSRRKTQYYEVKGTRAIYHNGWKAGTLHKPGADFNHDVWELYHLDQDYNELNDLATKNPAKLDELKKLFISEGEKFHVFPLKDHTQPFRRQTLFEGKKEVRILNGTPTIPDLASPVTNKGSFKATAEVLIPYPGTEGVLFSRGGREGGISFYVEDNLLKFTYVIVSDQRVTVASSELVPLGASRLSVEVVYSGNDSGKIRLFFDEKPVGETSFGATYPNPFYHEGFNIGYDDLTPVSPTYKVPFKFTGDLNAVTFSFL